MDKICVENLTRDYGGGRGVFGLSLSIQSGEVFGLLGPNGAGKTTLIRHLMGFIRPRSGRCRIDGLDCWTERHRVQAQVGYVPGEISFFEEMSGQQFLDFLERYRGAGPAARRRELIERFELDPKAPIARMSKGTKQKLAIVAAFMQDPELLVLDEPTSGLDPLMQNRFVELIQEEKRQGKTVFLSSQLLRRWNGPVTGSASFARGNWRPWTRWSSCAAAICAAIRSGWIPRRPPKPLPGIFPECAPAAPSPSPPR